MVNPPVQPVVLPTTDVPIPVPGRPSEDAVLDGFENFMLSNVRYVAVLVLVLVLAAMWKRPVARGILIGVLVLGGVIFVATN